MVEGETRPSLSPLFERLIATGFRRLASGLPTVLSADFGGDLGPFQAPEDWVTRREIARDALAERSTELLGAGPVLLVPPWERIVAPAQGRGSKRRKRHQNVFEEILLACRPAASGEAMAVLVPSTAWVSQASWAAELRTAMSEWWDTRVALYGQGHLMGISRSVQTAVVFLSPKDQAPAPVKIFRVPHRADMQEVEHDFQRLLARKGGRGTYGYVLRETPDPAEGLDFDRFDPTVEEQRADLAGFGKLTPLGDLYTCPSPGISEREARSEQWLCAPRDADAVRVITARDIGRDGAIARPSEDTRWIRLPEDRQLQVGDLVVRRMLPSLTDIPQGFVVAEVTEAELPAAATDVVTVLRPARALHPQQVRLAVLFLRTQLARKLAGSQVANASPHVLLPLPVPQPDEALASALDDLTAAQQQLKDWAAEAEQLLESVFLDNSAAQARTRLIGNGRALRLRVEAGTLLDDLGHTVRTRFPYPIAYRWRETEARISAGDTQAAYGAVLETAEIFLCYTAQIALALARAAGIRLGAVGSIREKLRSQRSGPGFGDWAAVLQEVATSRKLRALAPEHPLHDIRSLLADQHAAEARQRLSDRRNDEAHLRRIDAIDLPHATDTAFADLTRLVGKARFLADTPLLQLADVRWDSLTQTANIEYRELMGDHPVVPTKSMVSSSNELETGSLYLRDSDHGLHLLRPFLIGRDCPTCRTWSTFHIDKAPESAMILKSLEHGHVLTDDNPQAANAFQSVGLL